MDRTKLAGISAALAILTPFVVLLADKGNQMLAVLGGVPKVLAAWASGLPLGVGSFFLAVTLSTLLWLFLLPILPKARDGSRPHLSANLFALAASVAVCVGQQMLVAHGNGEVLRATIVGLIAGLLSPYLGLAMRSCFATTPKPPLPPPSGS